MLTDGLLITAVKNSRPRVVLDTNVWISGIVYGGPPKEILRLAIEKLLDILTSEQIFEETISVFERKFSERELQVEGVREIVRSHSELISTVSELKIIEADPSDNIILECALDGMAAYIVSGDKHLLALEQFRGIPILTPAQFLKLIDKKS